MSKYVNTFMMKVSHINDLRKDFSVEEIGEIICAISSFVESGEEPDFSDRSMRMEFRRWQEFWNYGEEKREKERLKKQEQRAKMSQMSSNVLKCPSMSQDVPNVPSIGKGNAKDKGKDKGKDNGRGKVTPSLHPSLTDIQHYLQAKNYTFTAERFYDYCSKKGWQNIDDWKKYADTWQAIEKPKKAKKRISDTMSRDEQTIKDYMNDLNDPTAL